jgi:hypothetical protein
MKNQVRVSYKWMKNVPAIFVAMEVLIDYIIMLINSTYYLDKA